MTKWINNMETTQKIELKRKILAAAIDLMEKSAADAKREMDDAQIQANEYGQPKDRYDSFKTKILRTRDMFAKQYSLFLNNIAIMQNFNADKICETVEYGAVVITNKQKMIILLGLGKIIVENQTYYAISINVPIYETIKGLKKGDEFIFNGIKQQIIDLF